MPDLRVATCCYCGRRTVLREAAGGHLLVCGSCGAPLTAMKRLTPGRAEAVASHAPRATAKPIPPRKMKARKAKKRKPLWRKMAEDIWDELEDLLD